MVTDADKGWVAGIIDFQGHVTRRSNSQRAAGSIQVTCYVETAITGIINRLCILTGTNPEPRKHSDLPEDWVRRGCVEHCPEAHVHNFRGVNMPDITKWSVSGSALAVVFWNVRPYMVSEEEPWDWAMAMSLASTRMSGQGSGAALTAVRRLHGLGWELPPLMRPFTDLPAGRLEAVTPA